MQRVLLLMTHETYKARAFLMAARALGCAPVVGTDRAQVLAPVDPAGNLLLPFRNIDRAVQRIVAHHRDYPIDAVVAADDDGAVLAAAAQAALGLPGNEVEAVRRALDKRATRRAFAAAGLPTPRFHEVDTLQSAEAAADDIGFPGVLKPVHLSASRGVMRVDDRSQLRAAHARLQLILQQAGSAPESGGGCLLESYLPGSEVAFEGVLRQGVLHRLALFDKPDPLEGPFFQETYYITPSRQSEPMQERITTAVQEAVQALQLRAGPIHAEVRVHEGHCTVLEVAPRSIGGRCSTALRFGADADTSLETLLLRQALQDPAPPAPREAAASGVLMIPIADAGILRQVTGQDAAAAVPGVHDVEITVPVGHAVAPPPEGWQYLGFVFARGATPESVEAALRQAHEHLQVIIEAPSSPATESGETA